MNSAPRWFGVIALVAVAWWAPSDAGALPGPAGDPFEAVQQAVEDCMADGPTEAAAAPWWGASVRLDRRDACELWAWAELGRHYPELATVALELEAKHNECVGRLNESRVESDRKAKQKERLARQGGQEAQKVRQLRQERDRRWKPPKAIGVAIGTGVGGVALGVIVRALTGPWLNR